MKFSELKYERIDFDNYQEKLNNIAEKIVNATSADEVFRAYEEYSKLETEYEENVTLSYIRAYQDSTDEYYNSELAFNMVEDAKLNRNVVACALLESSFRKEIDEKYGSQLLRIIEKNASLTKQAVEERSKLADVENRYQKLKATIKFEYNGKILSEGEIKKLKYSDNRDIRKEVTHIYYKTFADKRNEFMPILKEMVQLRNKIAKANGYNSYMEYMNVEKGRYTYGEKELTNLCELVKGKIVPIARQLYSKIKEDLGIDSYQLCDIGIYSKEGALTTSGNATEILEQGKEMYKDLSEDMYRLYTDMIEEELFDCESSPNKISGMGFATNLLKSNKTFVFANFNGIADSDIGVVTHEFGHAYQMSSTMKKVDIYDYNRMPNDLVEIPSKAMEQFSHDYANVFFKDKGEQYVREHKIGVLKEILAFCMTHEFETFLYTHEDATEEEIIQKYMELDEIYSGGIDISDEKELLEQGASMYRNMGLYMFPRYLISYVLSDITAITIKKIYDDNKAEGLSLYKKLCELGGTLEYVDAMKYLGLELAYSQEAMEVVRKSFMELLNC